MISVSISFFYDTNKSHSYPLRFVGKNTPVSQLSSAHFQKSSDPFQPFGTEPGDPFHSRKAFTDPFSGKDPFATTQPGKHTKGTSAGFANFGSVS